MASTERVLQRKGTQQERDLQTTQIRPIKKYNELYAEELILAEEGLLDIQSGTTLFPFCLASWEVRNPVFLIGFQSIKLIALHQ